MAKNVPIRLRHVTRTLPGYSRELFRGKFRYRDERGYIIRDDIILRRIRRIVIPPAWENVWICPFENGHLQAVGRDARGRLQYRYHAAWMLRSGGEKYTKLIGFGQALPRIRARVQSDLAQPGLPRDKVLATVVKLLDRTALRIGNTEYVRTNHSFGLTTLRNRHVAIRGISLLIRFRGKSGVWHERKVTDPLLARIVRRCRDLPGQNLFEYVDSEGKPHPIGSAEVNRYIRRAAGAAYTAKDYRTWAGTVKAAALLAMFPSPNSEASAKAPMLEVIDHVARELGNTPAVCKKSYIHPAVFDAFIHGRLRFGRKRRGLSAEESMTLRILQPARTKMLHLLHPPQRKAISTMGKGKPRSMAARP